MMNKSRGFSLVEVLVGSAIVGLLGLTVYSFFASSQQQLSQISSQSRLVESSDFLHNAYRLLAMSCVYAVTCVEYDSVYREEPINLSAITRVTNADKVIFMRGLEKDSTWKALSVRNGWLYEISGNKPSDTANVWSIFRLGEDSIQVGNSRPFTLLQGRGIIRFNPGFIRRSSNLDDSLYFPSFNTECKFRRL